MHDESNGGSGRWPVWTGLLASAAGLLAGYSYRVEPHWPAVEHMERKYPIGLNRAGDTLVYTNRGIGSHPLGLRLNCRPEVTVLTLEG